MKTTIKDPHATSNPPPMEPVLTRLINWASEACESTRASLDPDSDSAPSWLAELECIVENARELAIRPGHITTRAEFGFTFSLSDKQQFRAVYNDNISRQMHWQWFETRKQAVDWLTRNGATIETTQPK